MAELRRMGSNIPGAQRTVGAAQHFDSECRMAAHGMCVRTAQSLQSCASFLPGAYHGGAILVAQLRKSLDLISSWISGRPRPTNSAEGANSRESLAMQAIFCSRFGKQPLSQPPPYCSAGMARPEPIRLNNKKAPETAFLISAFSSRMLALICNCVLAGPGRPIRRPAYTVWYGPVALNNSMDIFGAKMALIVAPDLAPDP